MTNVRTISKLHKMLQASRRGHTHGAKVPRKATPNKASVNNTSHQLRTRFSHANALVANISSLPVRGDSSRPPPEHSGDGFEVFSLCGLVAITTAMSSSAAITAEVATALTWALGFTFSRLVNLHLTTAEFLPIQCLNGGLRFIEIVHSDKCDAARSASVTVEHKLDPANTAMSSKCLFNSAFIYFIRQIAYENIHYLLLSVSFVTDTT